LKNKEIAPLYPLLLSFSLNMPRPARRVGNQKGFTLIELMIGLFLAGLVFMIMFSLMGQTAKFASFFNNTATSIEGVSEAVTQLNAILPQMVRVRQCGCRGAAGTAMSNCTWSDTSPWYNPIMNAGQSNTGNGGLGHLLLDGDFEHYFGGDNTANTTQLLRTQIVGTGFGASLGGCQTYSFGASGPLPRGCKLRIRLFYNAPVIESGVLPSSTPSRAGRLSILIGDAAPAESVTSNGTLIKIGAPEKGGAGGLGVTELACGFVNLGGDTAGMLFALNFKIKARSTMSQNPGHPNYESWYPTTTMVSPAYSGNSGKNYQLGIFREIRLRYAFRNLGTRGLYHWRTQSIRDCKRNGRSATNREECCSLAIEGGTCRACIPGGAAASDASACCSEKVSGGNCI
jgi:prepilin-type N-terminal cleavage/methylation domain-containing protein